MSEPNINADALQSDLIKAFGGDQGLPIYRSLMSCTDRLTYAEMRLHEIENVIVEKIVPNFERWRDSYDVSEPEGVFHESQWQIRMLATEAVQHLHSVFDPLACAVYWFAVAKSSQRLQRRELNFYGVLKCADVGEMYQKKLSAISNSDSYFHLAALSNLAKHSRIVRPSFSHLSNGLPPPSAAHALEFESCNGPNPLNKERRLPVEMDFPKTPISIFLRGELLRVAPLFNELARLIRTELDLRLKAIK